LSVVSVVGCQVKVSAANWSLAQRSPTDCGASCVWSRKPHEWGGHSPRWAAAPYENKNQYISVVQVTMNSMILSQLKWLSLSSWVTVVS
jgi:hypothetical protein